MTQIISMRLGLFLLSFIFFIGYGSAQNQILTSQDREGTSRDLERSTAQPKRERPPINLYKIISVENDTTVVDTSLTVRKLYKFNYLRQDNFDLLPFSNEGQTYNSLIKDFSQENIMPLFGARARHFNYMEVDDIYYYNVPTPLTELYYKSVFQQGQNLDAFFTMNKSKRFNFSIAYKGLRSLGNYQNILTSTGNFRFTANYQNKSGRYNLKAHYVAQDLLNQENGGLTPQALVNFRSNDSQFDDRAVLSVNFQNAESILDGSRFYLNHKYDLIRQDSLSKNRIEIGHVLNYETKFYRYDQTNPATNLFGNSFVTQNISDKTDLSSFNNKAFVRYSNNILGSLGFQINHTYFKYGYNSVLIQDDGRIPNQLVGNILAAGASYKKEYRGFELAGDAQLNISGDFQGYNLNARAGYNYKDKARFLGSLQLNSSPANYNHLLYQSSYENYNWYNESNYENIKTQTLSFKMDSDAWLNAQVSLVNRTNYTYFAADPESGLVNSFQTGDNITYLKAKVNKEFRVGKFALDNTLAYQEVTGGDQYLNVPQFITRNTLYFTDEWFKKALFVQTGLSLKYFTSYTMDAYDPVLAEFYVQNTEELGDFPLVDLFFNMKVRQTRIFFIGEHINSLVSPNNYFSAPGYPYRDFTFRFGLVWNFFL